MEIVEVMESRHSCREFAGKPLREDKHKYDLIHAACSAPFASGGPRRTIGVIDWVNGLEELCEACFGQPYVKTCSAAFVFSGVDIEGGPWDSHPEKLPKGTVMASGHAKYIFDCAAACMCTDLAAVSLGYGTCWIGNFDWEKVRKVTGRDERPVIILLVGVPAE